MTLLCFVGGDPECVALSQAFIAAQHTATDPFGSHDITLRQRGREVGDIDVVKAVSLGVRWEECLDINFVAQKIAN